MQLSTEQRAAVDTVSRNTLTCVQAPGGAGKTFLIEQMVSEFSLSPTDYVYTAFNKMIVTVCADKGLNAITNDALAGRSPIGNTERPTYHGRVKYRLKAAKRDAGLLAKLLKCVELTIGQNENGESETLSPQTVASIASAAVVRYALSADQELSWWHVAKQSDGPDDRSIRETILGYAKAIWADTDKGKGSLPLDKSILFASIKKHWCLAGAHIPYRVVFIDEAQDTSDVMIRAIEQWAEHGIKVVLLGDRFQELYAWAGCSNAIDRMVEKGAAYAELRTSRRYGPKLATLASSILAEHSKNTTGFTIEGIGPDTEILFDDTTIVPQLFLGDTNATVIGAAMGYYGKGLAVSLPEHVVDPMVETLEAWQLLQSGICPKGEFGAFKSWSTLAYAIDNDERFADLVTLKQATEEHSIEPLLDMLKASKERRGSIDVVCSTVHRSKGLEANTVTYAPKPRKRDKEGNLIPLSDTQLMARYVAVTRAREVLNLVGYE